MTNEERRSKHNAAQREYYAANRERLCAAEKARYTANPDRYKEIRRVALEANRGKHSAAQRAYRIENPEKMRAQEKARRDANPEARRAGARDWHAANKDNQNRRAREKRAANPAPFREYEKARYHANKEKIRAQAKVNYAANPEKYRASALRSKFGMSVEHYGAMLAWQNGVCAICSADTPGSKGLKRLFIDHCHASGIVRGLLCHHCNAGIGHFKDDPGVLKKAIVYLQKRATKESLACKSVLDNQPEEMEREE